MDGRRPHGAGAEGGDSHPAAHERWRDAAYLRANLEKYARYFWTVAILVHTGVGGEGCGQEAMLRAQCQCHVVVALPNEDDNK